MCTIQSHRGMVKGQGRVKGDEFIKLLSSTTRTKYRYDFNRVLTWDLWTQSSPSQPFYPAQFRELFNRKLPGLNPAPCPAAAPNQPPSTAKKLCKEHTNHEAGAYQSNLNPARARARYGAGGGRDTRAGKVPNFILSRA